MKTRTDSPAFFEPLEQRRLLSTIHLLPGYFIPTPTGPGITEIETQTQNIDLNPPPHLPLSAHAQLVGHWTGKVKVKALGGLIRKSYSFALNVTKQTKDRLYGSVTFNHKTHSGSFKVHFLGDGHIVKFHYHHNHVDGTIKLWANADNTQVVGNFKGTAYGISGNGRVTLTKVG